MSSLQRDLIVITGQEGVGKTTVMRALLPRTPLAAKVDAEDLGQVHPFRFGQPFLELLWTNVVAVIDNFWAAAYSTVITGSLLDGDTFDSFKQFCANLPGKVEVYLVRLQADHAARNTRRLQRSKPSTQDWRDQVDSAYPVADTNLRDHADRYRYLAIDNSAHQIEDTIEAICTGLPEIYRDL